MAEKKKELFAIIRPSGTTGNLQDDFDATTFSVLWTKKGITEVIDYGRIGNFCIDKTKIVCKEKKKERFKPLSMEEAKEKYPEFFKDFEGIAIIGILKGHERN